MGCTCSQAINDNVVEGYHYDPTVEKKAANGAIAAYLRRDLDGYEEVLGVLLHKSSHCCAVLPKTKTVCNKVMNRRQVVEAQIQSDAALSYKMMV